MMAGELLTPDEMGEADRLTFADGRYDGMALMAQAGAAVAAIVLERFADASAADVLCGPGNNGGDGYVIAARLAAAGMTVRIWAAAAPKTGTDAARARLACPLPAGRLAAFRPLPGAVVIDALYGAGLSKPVDGDAAKAIGRIAAAGLAVVAVDLPSGVSGATGAVLGSAPKAAITVTFFRKKPAHLLLPARLLCGETIVAQVGIDDGVLAAIRPQTFENLPGLFADQIVVPPIDTHKYARGHVAVFSGGPSATGAARLSAMAAARSGAGAVTLLSPPSALSVNAAHLTSIILHRTDGFDDVETFLRDRRPGALVFGPGFGTGEATARTALDLITAARGLVRGIVFDADALSGLATVADRFVAVQRHPDAPALVLTPHQGEFSRLFPDLADDAGTSKLDKARAAAVRAQAVIVYKGPDTVIAAPNGRAAINSNGTAWLATAGSGDVLSGIIAALLAQGMPAFQAAAMAVWVHAEAAARFGAGLIAEDLPLALVPVLRELIALRGSPGR